MDPNSSREKDKDENPQGNVENIEEQISHQLQQNNQIDSLKPKEEQRQSSIKHQQNIEEKDDEAKYQDQSGQEKKVIQQQPVGLINKNEFEQKKQDKIQEAEINETDKQKVTGSKMRQTKIKSKGKNLEESVSEDQVVLPKKKRSRNKETQKKIIKKEIQLDVKPKGRQRGRGAKPTKINEPKRQRNILETTSILDQERTTRRATNAQDQNNHKQQNSQLKIQTWKNSEEGQFDLQSVQGQLCSQSEQRQTHCPVLFRIAEIVQRGGSIDMIAQIDPIIY